MKAWEEFVKIFVSKKLPSHISLPLLSFIHVPGDLILDKITFQQKKVIDLASVCVLKNISIDP